MLFDEFWLKSQAFIILLFIISIVNCWSAKGKLNILTCKIYWRYVTLTGFCCKNTMFYRVSANIISDQVFHTLPSDFECMYEQ